MAERPDGRYSLVEIDRDTKSEAATVGDMKRFTITVPTAVVIALITAFAGVATTYLSTRKEQPAAPSCLTREEFNESMRVRDLQLYSRISGIETSVTLLLVRTDKK